MSKTLTPEEYADMIECVEMVANRYKGEPLVVSLCGLTRTLIAANKGVEAERDLWKSAATVMSTSVEQYANAIRAIDTETPKH